MSGGDRGESVEIRGKRVILRDPRPEDVEGRLRWSTVEVTWQDWDAPWEGRSLTVPGRDDEARHAILQSISKPLPTPRTRLWIEHKGGPLLGWVSQYHYDEKERTIWAGINICESAFWSQGLGTEALRLWLGYLFDTFSLEYVRLGTWSGNARMIRCAQKCGFTLIDRTPHCRQVRGEWYDGLEFRLLREEWEAGKGGSATTCTVNIEPAARSDIGACLPLLSDLHKGDIGETMSDCLAEFCTAPNAVALIARQGSEVAGLIAGIEAPDLDFERHVAIVNAIVVAAQHRGTGIGRALVEAFVDWAQRRQCAAVLYSTAREDAKRFVRALGFVPGSPASTFIKHLVPPEQLGRSRDSEKEQGARTGGEQ